MTHAEDRDEVDRKFAELVSVEFGREVGAVRPELIEDDLTANRQATSATPQTDSGAEIDDLWFNDDVDYRNTAMPPIQWRRPAVLGMGIVAAGMLVGLTNLLGWVNLTELRWVSLALMTLGVGVLLTVALRRNPDPDDQPGAVL